MGISHRDTDPGPKPSRLETIFKSCLARNTDPHACPASAALRSSSVVASGPPASVWRSHSTSSLWQTSRLRRLPELRPGFLRMALQGASSPPLLPWEPRIRRKPPVAFARRRIKLAGALPLTSLPLDRPAPLDGSRLLERPPVTNSPLLPCRGVCP